MNPLGDGVSSVQIMDHMGSDLTVVNAARVSMHKESNWETDGFDEYIEQDSRVVTYKPRLKLSAKDEKLIGYLARHNHWTPFSHPQVMLRIKMPIFIARQWFKHQVGFTRNEVSRRYVSEMPEFYYADEWRKRAPNVKQGSSEEFFSNSDSLPSDRIGRESTVGLEVGSSYFEGLSLYRRLLDKGVCPEQARMVLPQSMYTEFVETGSLAAYARLVNLRLDPHAQKEVRLYAEAVSELIAPLFPVSWAALTRPEVSTHG